MLIILFWLKNLGRVLKLLNFKVNIRIRITNYNNNNFSKGYTENWSGEVFIINSVLKTNPWTYKIKDLNGEKLIESFHEKKLLLSILSMNYYLEPDSHIRDKVRVVLDFQHKIQHMKDKKLFLIQKLVKLRIKFLIMLNILLLKNL